MTLATFNIISIAVLLHCFVFTMAAELYIGSDLINRTFTFEDAKRVFIDVHPQHRLPNGGKLVGFAMYVRPIPNFQRDHYARFCIWTKIPNRDKTTFKLKYQTAARFPKQLGIYTTRIDDDVFTTDSDYFGVTYEQETGTITRAVDANGKLMFSDVYDNLPNTNDEIVIIQENYLNVMSMQAIIDDGTSVACNSGYSRDSNGNCIDINECLNNNGGCDQNCNNNEGSFTCSCRSGFSLQSNGRSCQSNDQCSNSGCQHRCVNTGNSYYCECFNGYTLDSNGRTCNDINECLNNNGGCDQICNNNEGSFTCSCRSGFSLQSNGRSCQSNDQCSNSGCQHRCVNTGNSYYCECFNGYTLDSNGRTCNDINECLNNNGGCDQICNNNEGSFTCSCRSGFSLQSNGRSCQSNDQCSNSGCQHRCVNTGNSYYCECFNGYTLDSNSKTCNNINECLNNNGGCDHNCNDNEGSFFCSCRSGYALESNARTCRETQAQYVTGPHGMTGATGPRGPEGQPGPPGAPGDISRDTNECPGGCQHNCINTFGSYYCECKEGYSLNSNGRNCDNINECATNNGMCEHSCDDREGTYICSCRNGYRLSPNNHNCQDIDECEEKKPCGSETCVNTIGGYRCVELRFLNDVSGYQDEPRIAKASVSVPLAEQSKLMSEKDSIVENSDADFSTDIRVVIWLGALSVLMALLVGANFLFCRKRSSEERQRLTESTTDHSLTDHSVTETELEENHMNLTPI